MQGIVERAHCTLKLQIQKQKRGVSPMTPQNIFNHVLFTLNILNTDDDGRTAAERFWFPSRNPLSVVRWKDLVTNEWHGPDPILVWGRGHVCIFPEGADRPH